MENKNKGWIKLYRDLKTKPIWLSSTPEQKTIFITLLLMANHESSKWEWHGKQFACKPGQFITSVQSIIDNCGKGISRQNVRTALNKFKKYEFLTYETTKSGMLITIVNWAYYQDSIIEFNQQSNQCLTNSQPTPNQHLTTNKNNKNNKNDKKISNSASASTESTKAINAFFEDIWKLYPNKKGKGQVSDTTKRKLYSIGFEEMQRAIERYKTELEKDSDWRKAQNGSTFFNSGYIDYLDTNYKPSENILPKVRNQFNNYTQTTRSDTIRELENMFLQEVNESDAERDKREAMKYFGTL